MQPMLGAALGRPFAFVMLLVLVSLNILSELPRGHADTPSQLPHAIHVVTYPIIKARTFLFDSYQTLSPRTPKSQPVTIVAIDEKSLTGMGQWPWPRNKLALLVEAINQHRPAAIGLDIYMPEPDQTSPASVAGSLQGASPELIGALKSLPSNDALLALALQNAPTVLGAVGFDFKTYTTSEGMRSVPVRVRGASPLPFVRQYANVLGSLPELQAAASGQAIVSVDGGANSVHRIPLLVALGDQLIPSLAVEMLRVATQSEAVEVIADARGVQALHVADLQIPTLERGDIWPHFAKLNTGLNRYVSALDVLQGRVDPQLLSSKLVLIGLTGVGLNDMKTTALGEVVPGVEIQAQLLEALFDGDLLLRPWWLKWLEALLVLLVGSSIIWFIPRSNSRLAALFKNHPHLTWLILAGVDLVALCVGWVIFVQQHVLFDAVGFVVVFSLLMASLIGTALIEGMRDARVNLARLVDTGIMLGHEHDSHRLLKQTLLCAKEMVLCQSISLYLKAPDRHLNLALHSAGEAAPHLSLPLLGEAGLANHRFITTHALLSGQTIAVNDMRQHPEYDIGAASEFGLTPELTVRSVLAVPMKAGQGQTLGVILLVNALDAPGGRCIAFDAQKFNFIKALAAQVAVAIENGQLLDAQKALADSFIQIIAGAIDTKSPYTGGHCERVPELAFMLAEEACKVKTGPLADFDFKTEDEWREFRVGAWLHDCGKVTTPEYVIDKATKLETIYNRIHEVRLRFEILLRDAQIDGMQALQAGRCTAAELAVQLAERRAELQADFAFVASCNVGSEFMSPDKIERLTAMAGKTWWRHFDDRLGLAHDELSRYGTTSYEPLPAQEYLLKDKPCHLFERPPHQALDEKHGFKVKVPDYLYNQGELYNLCISRGTLNEEERFKINEHIIQTIVMLEQMPLPANLQRVPEYAGTHHETLMGTGYPRKLSAEQLSVPSRIMAIADIFEALTASDRPYKSPKPLSECVKILSHFKKDKHIDPVLFDLFLSSGVYQSYARRYLKPEQIDAVDISQYLG